MKNLIMYQEGVPSWVAWIRKRIKSNLNFLAIAEGPTGIGKSWAMLSIAYSIDEEFEPRQVAFSFREVMQILNSDWFNKKKWKIIIFDEAQTDISNRKWQSLTNNLMNYLLSTFRHRNVILLFTSPYSDFIDIGTMKLMHCKFEIRGHNTNTQKTKIRPKLLQYNSKLQKFYEHSLYVIRDNNTEKLEMWFVPKPPAHLITPYEHKKVEFTTELNKKILADLDRVNDSKPKTILDTGTIKQREAKRLYFKYNGDVKKIASDLCISMDSVYNRLGGREKMADLDDYIRECSQSERKRIIKSIPS